MRHPPARVAFAFLLAAETAACAPRPPPTTPGDEPGVAGDASETTPESPVGSTAAGLATVDIFLADLDLAASPSTVSNIRNATAREGYDNQPYFDAAGNRLLYTSIREEQSDLYALDLTTGETSAVRATPANEFSPTIMPGRAGISMIRESGGLQKLWKYSVEGEDQGALLPDLVDVGYHAWLSADDVALFLLDPEEGGERHRLEVVHLPDGSRTAVAENIGRCLATLPAGSLASGSITYVAMGDSAREPDRGSAPGPWTLMRFDLESGASTSIVQTRPGSEDYAWAPDGSLLQAQGTRLFRWTRDDGWAEIADLAREGVEEVTRLAISADGGRLAFVGGPAD